MPKNILHTIEKNMSSFSKGQKLIARFILEDYDKAAFMTASKLRQDRAGERVDRGAFCDAARLRWLPEYAASFAGR